MSLNCPLSTSPVTVSVEATRGELQLLGGYQMTGAEWRYCSCQNCCKRSRHVRITCGGGKAMRARSVLLANNSQEEQSKALRARIKATATCAQGCSTEAWCLCLWAGCRMWMWKDASNSSEFSDFHNSVLVLYIISPRLCVTSPFPSFH